MGLTLGFRCIPWFMCLFLATWHSLNYLITANTDLPGLFFLTFPLLFLAFALQLRLLPATVRLHRHTPDWDFY